VILGAHESTAGGVAKAAARAQEDTCDAVQIFVKSPNRWSQKPYARAQIDAFHREALVAYPRPRWTIHAGYLINLGGGDAALWEKSVGALRDELARGAQLGIPTLVLHPGSHKGAGVDVGLDRVARALDRVHAQAPAHAPRILVESMPGAGDQLLRTPEEIGALLDRVDAPERVGVCLDTCHLHAAGIRLWPRTAYEDALARFDAAFGLERVAVWHLNDSRGGLGSRLDRHEHIGRGDLGEDVFAHLLRDSRWQHVLGILETPSQDGRRMYRENLERLRELRDVE